MNSSIVRCRQLMLVAVVALSYAAAGAGHANFITWYPAPNMTVPASLAWPVDGYHYSCGRTIGCAINEATDYDTRYDLSASTQWTYHLDNLTYTWDKNDGAWQSGNTGRSVSWIAPSTPTTGITIGCTISDAATKPFGEGGTRDDDPNPYRSATISTVSVVYVCSAVSSSGDGSSWATAKKTINEGIQAATSGHEVWVAAGTYHENVVLVDGINVYGGFYVSHAAREQRDWNAYPTVIELDSENGADTVVAQYISNARLDGFTVRSLTTGWGYHGIHITTSENIEICHNTITSNCIGILTDYESHDVNIHDNYIYNNSSEGIWVEECMTNGATITNNTFADNGTGIFAWYSTVGIYNNIFARNRLYGVSAWTDDDTLTIYNNCAYANSIDYTITGGTWLSGNNITGNPELVGVHVQPNSPCIGAGLDNLVPSGRVDFDGEPRKNGTVDIGADESDGCGFYTITFTCDPTYADPTESIDVTVHFRDWYGNPPSPYKAFSIVVTDGYITSPVTNWQYTGYTDSSGDVTITVSRDTAGVAIVTATIQRSCGSGTSSKSGRVPFTDGIDDWPMFQHDVAHTGVSGCVLPADLEKKWAVSLNGSSSTANEETWASPVVVDGVVYVATNTGWLYAFNVNGTQLASLNIGAPIHGTPCVYDDLIYVGAEHNGSNGPGRLHVYALQSGQFVEQWYYDCRDTNQQLDSNQKIWGSPVVYSGAVYFGSTYNASGFYDGWFHTVDLTSHVDRGGSPAAMRYTAVGNAPGIDVDYVGTNGTEPRAYLSDYSCYVTAVRCDTGEWKWELPPDNSSYFSSPTIYDGHIFVGAGDPYVRRITDAGGSGQLDSSFGVGDSVWSTVAALEGKLYFGCQDGKVYCVDADTFQQADWMTNPSAPNTPSPITSSTLISGPTGVIFTCTEDGVLYALDIADGTVLWSYDISGEISGGAAIKSSPAASDGKLFIVAGNSSGRYLYCFGP